ncbi:hypothetical protein LZ30DRAFT_378734 [Colletotrichum cereale]|nr:hypothetical protein LZ30DRAFT_378734 [Colletotrichum cereale]
MRHVYARPRIAELPIAAVVIGPPPPLVVLGRRGRAGVLAQGVPSSSSTPRPWGARRPRGMTCRSVWSHTRGTRGGGLSRCFSVDVSRSLVAHWPALYCTPGSQAIHPRVTCVDDVSRPVHFEGVLQDILCELCYLAAAPSLFRMVLLCCKIC